MSVYMFGGPTHKPSRQNAARIAAIAELHGAEFIEVNVKRNSAPGINHGEYQSWFSCENLGAPFDGVRAEAIYSDMRQAKILQGEIEQ